MGKVLLLLSGVYPHYMGGVSTWADYLVNGLQDFDFTLVSLVSNPHVELRYKLPGNVKRLITVPLWGSDRPEEYDNTGFTKLVTRTLRTSRYRVKKEFCPYYSSLVEEFLRGGKHLHKMSESLVNMKQFFEKADYGKVMRMSIIWDTFKEVLLSNPLTANISTYQSINLCRLLEKYLKILTVNPGKQDLIHCGIAGNVGLLGVVEKQLQDIKLITTEHGIYFRERILDMLAQQMEDDLPARINLLNFYLGMVRLVLRYSDEIYPVCSFNAKWEKVIADVEPSQVIYNGIDTMKFAPAETQRNDNPTIVSVIRVDRLKDPLTMIRAMSHIIEKIPDAKYLIYGPGHDEDYALECEEAVERMNLERSVFFEGYTSQPEKAYHRGDVFALPSVSEGFPFALIEAMSAGLPIVASDVGGVREALEGCGVLVSPTNPGEMAVALVNLLEDKEQAKLYGSLAREKAYRLYNYRNMIESYNEVYHKALKLRTGVT